MTVPATALAQALRRPERQARLARLIRPPTTDVVSLDRVDATNVGRLLAASGTSDIADAHVVICARCFGQPVVTSDPGDLQALDPAIQLIRVRYPVVGHGGWVLLSRVVGSSLRVVRQSPGLTWRAFDDGEAGQGRVVGAVTAFLRPDNRWFVFFDDCRGDAYQPLLAAVAANTGSDLYANADEADQEAVARFARLGFTQNRQEGIFLIPTDPASTGLRDVPIPDETVIISAADADEDDLRLLDEALKAGVPGNDGWVWDPGDFHEETFGPDFDPATYLVAADLSSGSYIGLVRIWVGRRRSRLGLIAVLPPYQRRGVAMALLGRAFGVLHERGQAEVSAEIDDTNTASLTLLGGMGARRQSGTIEYIKRITTHELQAARSGTAWSSGA